VKRKKGKH
jgi:hypothetical protein